MPSAARQRRIRGSESGNAHITAHQHRPCTRPNSTCATIHSAGAAGDAKRTAVNDDPSGGARWRASGQRSRRATRRRDTEWQRHGQQRGREPGKARFRTRRPESLQRRLLARPERAGRARAQAPRAPGALVLAAVSRLGIPGISADRRARKQQRLSHNAGSLQHPLGRLAQGHTHQIRRLGHVRGCVG